ncbi:uracil-xanthine permease family protein [Bacillota bacterium Meth-B3]|nr:solute carrier family 23 protein [Christensenellaceae bacterium]MEA5068213.1 solute carrier family 23 protein [Christensenellaceae bacterium]
MMKSHEAHLGYLPDERPPFLKLLLYALQQVVVMFPATVAVALITGFQVSTTIFASGLATLCFILITGRKIPLYYGSSFAYLNAVSSLMATEAITQKLSPEALAQLNAWSSHLTSVLPGEAIAYAQFGIIMSGLVSIAAGLAIRFFGRNAIEKILPPSITGSIAMIIGLTLAGNALRDAAPVAGAAGVLGGSWVWVVSLSTLLSTVLFSRYLKGFLGQLPLLLGAAVGCAVAAGLYAVGGPEMNLFRAIPAEALSASLWTNGVLAVPAFTLPKASAAAVFAIMPIAIATIPESTAHMYQLDIYVNDVARKKGVDKKYNLIDKLDLNLIGDGLCDMVSGVVGGPAGTNYGENISTMAITRVFSVPVLAAAAVIAMVISFFTPLIRAIYGIPMAVIGGLEVYLFGAIAAQGIAIMIEKQVDMFSAKNIAVIATIMTIGVGGQYAFGGNIDFLGLQVPCIAGAAIFGIALNLLLSIGEKK